jgi:hypothetical protein
VHLAKQIQTDMAKPKPTVGRSIQASLQPTPVARTPLSPPNTKNLDDSRVKKNIVLESHQPKSISSHLERDEGSYSYKPVRSASKQSSGQG